MKGLPFCGLKPQIEYRNSGELLCRCWGFAWAGEDGEVDRMKDSLTFNESSNSYTLNIRCMHVYIIHMICSTVLRL